MSLKLDYESRFARENKTRARMHLSKRIVLDLAIITAVVGWLTLVAWGMTRLLL
jgi:hypothetical protein